jgi:hypothetical protein
MDQFDEIRSKRTGLSHKGRTKKGARLNTGSEASPNWSNLRAQTNSYSLQLLILKFSVCYRVPNREKNVRLDYSTAVAGIALVIGAPAAAQEISPSMSESERWEGGLDLSLSPRFGQSLPFRADDDIHKKNERVVL